MGLSCGICFEPFDEPVSIPCGHVFCAGCLAKIFEDCEGFEVPCPTCRVPFPTIAIDPHIIPRKYRPHITPCIRKLYLDDASDASESSQRAAIESLQSQLAEERAKVAELEQERKALCDERDSLYRMIELYKNREKEIETRDRRQKYQVATQVDELMESNQRLQTRLEEAQGLLATMGIDKRTPPPPSRPVQPSQPSTPRSTPLISRTTPFPTPTTPRSTLNFSRASLSPLKGGLAVAREDQAARFRIYNSPIKPTTDIPASPLKLGGKRQRDPQEDIDMLSSEGEQNDPDETITPGNSRRVFRPSSGISGRSVRRKFGVE